MILLRKLHRYTGITIAPLVLLQAVTGFLLRIDSIQRYLPGDAVVSMPDVTPVRI